MSKRCTFTVIIGTFLVVSVAAAVTARVGQPQPSKSPVSAEQYERWKKELSNWGRWGKDDKIGTLNLITSEKTKQAAALVRDGFSVSIARYWANGDVKDTEGGATDVTNPYELSESGNRVEVSIHGQATTHFDGWAHIFFGGVGYNGYRPDPEKAKTQGHPELGVQNARHGIVTRGILIDVPRLKNLEYLEPGTRIYAEDLEAWEKKTGLRVTPGDAMFVRTGRWTRRAQLGPWYPGRAKKGIGAGLDASVLPWLKQRGVALLGADASSYVYPDEPHVAGAAHDFSINVLGLPGVDICDMEELAAAAAKRNRWEFMLVVAPLPIRGATGSPINPIAVF